MERRSSYALTYLATLVLVAGCAAPPVVKKEAEAPRKPDVILQVASLNLSGYDRKFGKGEMGKFSNLLKKEQIDVLSVQGITRYPELTSRVDFVKELASKTDMRYTFGEMYNSGGRQDGNAIFSIFPQRNNHNDAFDGVKSADFESALQSSVDGGVKDVVVVSTVIPPKANEADQSACLKIIASKSVALPNQPMILTGNLPVSQEILSAGSYEDAETRARNENLKTRIWYSSDKSLKLMGTRIVETEFGSMVVAKFGLFQ